MSDLKKIAALFVLCLVLAAYAKWSGNTPIQIGVNVKHENNVLGTQTSQPSFANLVPK